MSRRRLLGSLAAAPTLSLFPGCAELVEGVAGGCPADPAASGDVTWIPDVAHPVSWGVHDLTTASGAPRDMMIYYPAALEPEPVIGIETTARRVVVGRDPLNTPRPMLKLCIGRWPVVVFLHGGPPPNVPVLSGYYRQWWRLPSTLARCGYVVVVPNHVAYGDYEASPADIAAVMRDVDWVRTQWSEAEWVDQRPTSTALAGHSNGARLAGATILAHPEIGAFVSLSGGYAGWDRLSELPTIATPSFFMWAKLRAPTPGVLATNSEEDLDIVPPRRGSAAASMWDELAMPKHAAVFEGHHFDYLDDSGGWPRGACPHIGALAADLTALFISSNLASLTQVPLDLSPPQVQLTPNQQRYAQGHLSSFDQVRIDPRCKVELRWSVGGVTGSRALGPSPPPTPSDRTRCLQLCQEDYADCRAAGQSAQTCLPQQQSCNLECPR